MVDLLQHRSVGKHFPVHQNLGKAWVCPYTVASTPASSFLAGIWITGATTRIVIIFRILAIVPYYREVARKFGRFYTLRSVATLTLQHVLTSTSHHAPICTQLGWCLLLPELVITCSAQIREMIKGWNFMRIKQNSRKQWKFKSPTTANCWRN